VVISKKREVAELPPALCCLAIRAGMAEKGLQAEGLE
jgi:hypothetical protein